MSRSTASPPTWAGSPGSRWRRGSPSPSTTSGRRPLETERPRPEPYPSPGSDLRPGSREDFDLLYRRSHDRVLLTLIAILGDKAAAEDCTQETFVRAFKAWDRWRPDSPPEAWLHRIAINVAHSYRQRQRLREVGEVIKRLGRPAEGPNPEDVAEQNEVIGALSRIPPAQAAALVLRHYHGYSNREIARSLGIPERTVASRLARAKARLRSEVNLPDAEEVDSW